MSYKTLMTCAVACLFSFGSPLGAELRAGAAAVEITPPLGGPMYGYGARGENTSQGVHDSLFARALVITDGSERLGIVALDLGSISSRQTATVRSQVQSQTGIEHLVLTASHTHSAPRIRSDFPSSEDSWVRILESRIVSAVVEAAQNLERVRIGVAYGKADLCHNRRKVHDDGTVEMLWANRQGTPTSPVDHQVAVAAFDTVGGEPMATLVSFACHPVVLGPENLEISADYPGIMADRVQSSGGGIPLYLPAAAGDINPFWDKTSPSEGGFERTKDMGEALASVVLETRRRASVSPIDGPEKLAVSRLSISMEPRWDLSDPELRQRYREAGAERLFDYYAERFRKEQQAEINVVLLGSSLALATFPGEFFVEHGLRLKSQSLVRDTIFVGYANGELGYFPTIRAAAEGGYGATEASFVEVGAGDLLVNSALRELMIMSGHLSLQPSID